MVETIYLRINESCKQMHRNEPLIIDSYWSLVHWYLFFYAKGPGPDRLNIQKQSARENIDLTSEIFRQGNSHTFYR